ncbi:MAG: hypothetical protein FWG13_00745 [Leptospirales bacterium]|nr:hypothetical protein [Leptospirales bacterium]
MTVILSQQEIDQLLSEMIPGFEISDFESSYFENNRSSYFESIEDFEEYLTKRKFTSSGHYGNFNNDVSICRFFDSAQNENLLEDIKRKNEEQGYGNIKIPNTDITLINYSFCQTCKTIFSFKEVVEYYKNPKSDPGFESREHQYREDTRVYCNNCGAYFLPSLIISDGTPKNEVQFLCRVQTIYEVEKYFLQRNITVLTRNKHNIVRKGARKAIKNDVYIKNLGEKPTLVTNMIQYTPFNLIMNLLDGTNVEKGDLLFDEWKPLASSGNI